MSSATEALHAAAAALRVSHEVYGWGVIVVYMGTFEELRAAGLVNDLHGILPACGTLNGRSEYGDQITVSKRKGGRYRVECLLSHKVHTVLMTQKNKTAKALADRVVADALDRIMQRSSAGAR